MQVLVRVLVRVNDRPMSYASQRHVLCLRAVGPDPEPQPAHGTRVAPMTLDVRVADSNVQVTPREDNRRRCRLPSDGVRIVGLQPEPRFWGLEANQLGGNRMGGN